MTEAIETFDLGKRYGKQWALQSCSFSLPAGRIAGLVGPNGAGKTTLMHMLVGLLLPSCGRARIFGFSPEKQLGQVLRNVGFVGQDRPLYRSFSVNDMLRFGRELNPSWDETLALERLRQLNIPLDRPTGRLSGGQQAQVALSIALAKRPRLLILDEPLASLDPLARHEFMQTLMDSVARDKQTVLVSSHQVSDIERICDSMVLLSHSRLMLADDLEHLLDSHIWVTCSPESADRFAHLYPVVRAIHTNRSSRLMIRVGPQQETHLASELVEDVSLDELILAYLSLRDDSSGHLWIENDLEEVTS